MDVELGGGKDSGVRGIDAFCTKFTMACLVTPSFHEGRGSFWIALGLLSAASAGTTAHINAAVAASSEEPFRG